MPAIKPRLRNKIEYTCPRCRRTLERINRTGLDKVIGLIIPIRRYKCMGCFWEGVRVYHSREYHSHE